MTDAQIKALIAQGVADALAERDANRSRNGDDNHDSRSDGRRRMLVARECTYSDFLKCQLLNFKGTKVVIGLTQWLERMESVFHISNCAVRNQVKYATYTLLGNALMWWISHVKTVGHDAAYGMLRMFPDESDKVKKYVGGLPDMIQGSVMASKPKKMHDAIEFATELMDQKIHTLAERQAENKRKLEDTSRNNQNKQQPFKRHNVAQAYTARPGEKKPYRGSKPLDVAVNTNTQRGVISYECEVQGHYKKTVHSRETRIRKIKLGMVTLWQGLILWARQGQTRTPMFSLIDIIPTTLDHGYDVKLADGKIIEVNTLIRGCKLNFMNHPFNIDLMPIELGSFDVIIGMDWLTKYHVVIVCDEKLVRVPFENEILIFCGDESNNGDESWLNIISCTKTQKYMLKGCQVFLAHITIKMAEDKSEEKRLEDVPIVRDFPKVFPEDLPGIPLV
ncbi:putative reverse transcriptase domain-containing protein [Tanacetum coccineum]